jgi:hypothetical protein
VVHHCSVITELGLKARVITIPPASVFAQGDLVRQVVWPRLLKRVPQILPYSPRTEEGILARVVEGFQPGRVFLSADLTCATDGFGHDAILAVVNGLRKAGLPADLYAALVESLGVGPECHYVRYRLSQLEPAEADRCRRTYPVVDGCVEVPKVRGSLMGTPCSFTILSLINHWMSEYLGPRRIICGDDLAANTHPDNVRSYAQRASAVGSQLHEGKSFRSRIGFVFCEAYGLLSKTGKGLTSFRPPSLKEFVRKGNGVMSQHSVDPSSFNRLARCARTIYHKQRLFAMKMQRPPELPAALGGLGHPCKGRLRVPLWCRRALWELYLCTSTGHDGPHNPGNYIRTLQQSAIPASRGGWKNIRRQVEGYVGDRRIPDDSHQPGDVWVPSRALGTYVAICTNLSYLDTRKGFRRVRPQDIVPRKLRWPKPCPSTGVLSTHTRIVQVLEWDRRARCELGTYFPALISAHIRKRTLADCSWEAAGDVES